jgi:hypothetical protein
VQFGAAQHSTCCQYSPVPLHLPTPSPLPANNMQHVPLALLTTMPPVLSHPCAQRCREIQSHVPEPFWYIHVTHSTTGVPTTQLQQQPQPGAPPQQQQQQQQQLSCDFTWARGRLYDEAVATVLYEMCCEQPEATVMQVGGVCSAAAAVHGSTWLN